MQDSIKDNLNTIWYGKINFPVTLWKNPVGIYLFKVNNRKTKKICEILTILVKRYTNADLKISLYVCADIKTISWKFRFLNPKNSWVICP